MFYLNNKDNPTLIILSIRINGKQLRYSTGQKIDPEDWNKSEGLPMSRRGNKGKSLSKINLFLSQMHDVVSTYLEDVKLKRIEGSKSDLKDILDKQFKNKKSTEMSFYDSLDYFIESSRLTMSKNTIQNYESLKKSLIEFNSRLEFKDLDYLFYKKYTNSMYEKGLRDNTVGSRIAKLKSFLRTAQKMGHHNNESYKEFKSKTVDVDNVALNWDELQSLKNYNGPPYKNRIRDLFLIGVLSGQRFSDYSVFNKTDLKNGFIVKRAKKTFEESVIPLNKESIPYLIELLEKYDWKLPIISDVKFNFYIKKICEKCGIDTPIKKIIRSGSTITEDIKPKHKFVSSHTARRTFITISLNRGINPLIVMKQTGITKMDTLKKYYKFDREEMIGQIGKVWKDF